MTDDEMQTASVAERWPLVCLLVKSILALHPIHNRVMRSDVRIKQLQARVVAGSALPTGDDDLRLGVVGNRDDCLRLNALADCLGLAHEVVACVASEDAARFGVGLEGQGICPSEQLHRAWEFATALSAHESNVPSRSQGTI